MEIRIENLKKTINDKDILKGINLSFKSGEILALLGPNGAGKSTLCRCISGLDTIDSGKIECDTEKTPKITMVFDHPVLYEHLTPEEHTKMVLEINGIREDYKNLICSFGIDSFKNKKLSECSLGMKKRVQLMLAMALQTDVLLLDEYISGLDPVTLSEMIERLKDYAKKGHIVVLATHILAAAQKMCNRAVLMSDGTVVDEIESIKKIGSDYSSLEDFYFRKISKSADFAKIFKE